MHGDVTEQHVQAVSKAERDGVEALTGEERMLYDDALILLQDVAAGISAQRQIVKDGLEAYARLSSVDQMRYQEWSARELLAFLPLIDGDMSED